MSNLRGDLLMTGCDVCGRRYYVVVHIVTGFVGLNLKCDLHVRK
jgi:hypothetical protein